MTDSLRTRIIAALARADQDWCSDNNLHEDMADAVIRELGLEPQVHYDPDCEFYRYVTDWIDPQTNQKVDLP